MSFVARGDGGAMVHASTLAGPDRQALARHVPAGRETGSLALADGEHVLRVRATDDRGRSQPDTTPCNELGYCYDAVLAHPLDVRAGQPDVRLPRQ